MEYRRACKTDLPAMASLWQEVFGDTILEAERYLCSFVGMENQFVACGPVAGVGAILSAVPCTCKGRLGVYFFALATSPPLRGQGIMAGLMAHAEQACQKEGAVFSCLIPAEASLFGYYGKNGYKTAHSRVISFFSEAQVRRHCVRENLTVPALEALREQYLPGDYVRFSAPQMEEVLAGARGGGFEHGVGFQLARGLNAYAVFMEKKEGLAVPELAAPNEAAAASLLAQLCTETGCSKAVATLPSGSPLFAGQGQIWPLMQYKPLHSIFLAEEIYLRFGLDEVFEKDFENMRLADGL